MKKILVIAPHPDDETLGCGGTLLKQKAEGAALHWVIASRMTVEAGFSESRIRLRDEEIASVARAYGFDSVQCLDFPSARLDTTPKADLVGALGKVVAHIEPDTLLVPFPGDVHTDHRIVYDAALSCSKWFRYGSIRRILAYETLSETDLGLNPQMMGFCPNVFVNIGATLDRKLEIMSCYASEIGCFPFPRSEKALRALASLRGASSGCEAAEAFVLLKEIIL